MPPCERGKGRRASSNRTGLKRKGKQGSRKRDRSRALCVSGVPLLQDHTHTLHLTATAPQLHSNPACGPLPSQRPPSSLCPAHGPTGGGKGSLLENAEGGREGWAGLDWTGLYAGGNAMSHLKQAKPIHSPCPPSFRPRPLVEIPCW